RKPQVMNLTTSFHFSLGTLFDPDFEPEGDQRLDILFAVTELLDGVLFTPSSLRDARGRILFGAGGGDGEDPHALWPRGVGEAPISEPLGAAMHEQSRRKPPGEANENAEPPTAARVARRALALTCVTARAVLEQDAVDDLGSRGAHDRLLAWARDVGIEDELEPDEQEVLQRPPGKLDEQMQINSGWRLEGLVVLAWALGRFELPPHDQLVSMDPLWRSLGLFEADAGALLANPTLRPDEEIGALRDRLFALHWRL